MTGSERARLARILGMLVFFVMVALVVWADGNFAGRIAPLQPISVKACPAMDHPDPKLSEGEQILQAYKCLP